MAGHADLAAAGLEQHALVEIGPRLNLLRSGGLEAGKRDRDHGDSCVRTPVLAGIGLAGHLPPGAQYAGLYAGG